MDLHEGPDRIEFSPLLGRPIRQGSWRELSVSDKERIEQALEARDLDRLTQYWGYLNFGHRLMVGLAYEWARPRPVDPASVCWPKLGPTPGGGPAKYRPTVRTAPSTSTNRCAVLATRAGSLSLTPILISRAAGPCPNGP